MARRPVNKLLPDSFWKLRSQMYYEREFSNSIIKYTGCLILKISHQHSGSEVKLVKELGNEDVSLHKVLLVGILNILDDLSKPLPLLLSTGHPDEEHLHIIMVNDNE